MNVRLVMIAAAIGMGLLPSVRASAQGVQAFLIQNSGWMEPFYTDSSSQFKALAQALIKIVAEPGDEIIVAAFNQSVGENRSPQLTYQGADVGQAIQSIAAIRPARKPGGVTFADTDFKEAITSVVTGLAKSRPTVIWILTNNRNSPGNDQNTAARNREFYELVHNEPSIISAFAYPLAMPVKGQIYSAKGLMVYALTYGQEAEAKLRGLMQRGSPASLFTDRPARLKPLDRDAMTFVPQTTESTERVRASLAADRKTLLLQVDATTTPQRVSIGGSFRNEFYPYEILGATISARLISGGWVGDLGVSPTTVEKPIAPGHETQVAVDLPLPASQFPSLWSPAALVTMGTQVVVPAELHIALDQQRLRVSDDFLKRLGEIFPGDPLPDVFRPPERISASVAVVPVQVQVAYPLYPLIVATVAVLAMISLGIVSISAMTRERRFDVLVNGQVRKLAIRPFATVDIKSSNGSTVATLTRGLGAPRVVSVSEGNLVSVKT